MRSTSVYFTGKRKVETRSEELGEPGEGEVLVGCDLTAISAGTELLLYRGELAQGTALDESLPSLAGRFHYPFRYGYAAAGRVVALGERVSEALLGARVFAFEPHGSHCLVSAERLALVPDDVPQESAVLLPTAETAVNLVLDGRPLVGEKILVVGQGVVGLLATAILARFPLARLVTVDPIAARRHLSEKLGAERSVSPEELDERDFDLTFEVSGSPTALDLAIGATGFEGRVVLGSWYGTKRTSVDLGTHFHRGRLTLLSSQVSHLGPHLQARWDKSRRIDVAFDLLSQLSLDGLVTHHFPVAEAAAAFALLDERPDSCLQVLLTYT